MNKPELGHGLRRDMRPGEEGTIQDHRCVKFDMAIEIRIERALFQLSTGRASIKSQNRAPTRPLTTTTAVELGCITDAPAEQPPVRKDGNADTPLARGQIQHLPQRDYLSSA